MSCLHWRSCEREGCSSRSRPSPVWTSWPRGFNCSRGFIRPQVPSHPQPAVISAGATTEDVVVRGPCLPEPPIEAHSSRRAATPHMRLASKTGAENNSALQGRHGPYAEALLLPGDCSCSTLRSSAQVTVQQSTTSVPRLLAAPSVMGPPRVSLPDAQVQPHRSTQVLCSLDPP